MTKKTDSVASDAKEGDVFSEISHFVFRKRNGNKLTFWHEEGKKEVEISSSYVNEHMATADQYFETIKVGKENKYWTAKQIEERRKKQPSATPIEVGDLKQVGMKTIFEDIGTSQVFTVCFKKKDTPLSKKVYEEKKNEAIERAVAEIEKAKKAKKSITVAAKKVIENLQSNPILPYAEGEDRILRGYKVQFRSEDGFYQCIDMDIVGAMNIRPVNINTIKWLVFDGVMYELEK